MDSKDDLERLNRQLNELISRQNEIIGDIKQLRVDIRTLEDKGVGQAQMLVGGVENGTDQSTKTTNDHK